MPATGLPRCLILAVRNREGSCLPVRIGDPIMTYMALSSGWQTHRFSIKAFASYFGFVMRDAHPSFTDGMEYSDYWIQIGIMMMRRQVPDRREDERHAT